MTPEEREQLRSDIGTIDALCKETHEDECSLGPREYIDLLVIAKRLAAFARSHLAEPIDPTPETAGDDGELLTESYVRRIARTICNHNYVLDEVSTRYFLRFECDDDGVDVGLLCPGNEDVEPIWVQSNQTVGQLKELCVALGVKLEKL